MHPHRSPPSLLPAGPLSDAAADEQLKAALPSHGSGNLAGQHGDDAAQQAQQVAPAGAEEQPEQTLQHEGDNSSFYGSDSNTSSQEGSGNSSCSCSERGSDEAEEGGEGSEGEGAECGSGAPRGASTGAACPGPALGGGASGASWLPGSAGQTLRRLRPRDRRRPGWRGSGGGSMAGEIPAGLIPERQRRRSEVGSVLEPEPQSDTEDAEVALTEPDPHA